MMPRSRFARYLSGGLMKITFLRAGAAVTAVLALAACGGTGSVRLEPQPNHTLTLLHSNDLHSHLEPFDSDPSQGGVARLKTAVDAVRAEVGAERTLLVDAGDYFQGTLFFNAWQGSDGVMALNAIGYDAVTLGNHEFDLGPAGLARALRGEPVTIAGVGYATERLRVPVVATNLDYQDEPALAGQGLFVKSVVVEKAGRAIGIVGATTSTTAASSSPGPNVRFLDYVDSVQAEVDRLTAAGIKQIVLLSHIGYSYDLGLAGSYTGVDVIVSGHDHRLLGDAAALAADPATAYMAGSVAGPYPTVRAGADGKPVLVVSAWEWGRVLGRLDLSFDDDGVLTAWSGAPIPINDSLAEDAALAAKVAEYKQPVSAMGGEVIGEAAVLLAGGTYSGVRQREMPLGNLVADVLLRYASAAYGAQVALTNGGGIRDTIAPGRVTFGQALAVLPFSNTIAVVDVSGAELVAGLDHALTWGYDPATASARYSGGFPQIAGMTVHYCGASVTAIQEAVVDGATPPRPDCPGAIRDGGVVTRVLVRGEPIDLAATYRVAGNDFNLLKGGDGNVVFAAACAREGTFCQDSGVMLVDELVREFREHSPVSRDVEGRLLAQ